MRSRSEEYELYLRSPQWIARRRAILFLRKHCEGCGARQHLDVHHVTYERLGRERPEDLRLLCHECHLRAHGRVRTEADRMRSNPRRVGDILRDGVASGRWPWLRPLKASA